MIIFEVEDTGSGIDAELLPRAFDMFERSGGSGGGGGGCGIGLSVSKQLVNAMGGEIALRSSGPGRGTTAVFSIPWEDHATVHVGGRGGFEHRHHGHGGDAEMAPDILTEFGENSTEEEGEGAGGGSGGSGSSGGQQGGAAGSIEGLHVLLAEDNDFNTVVLTHFLQDMRLQVTHAANGDVAARLFSAANCAAVGGDNDDDGGGGGGGGEGGVAVLRDVSGGGKEAAKGPFDLVVMDYLMPLCDGFEATRRIRASERAAAIAASGVARRVPIVGLTAYSTEESDSAGKEAGMDFLLHKPVDREAFVKLVASALRGSRALGTYVSQCHDDGTQYKIREAKREQARRREMENS